MSDDNFMADAQSAIDNAGVVESPVIASTPETPAAVPVTTETASATMDQVEANLNKMFDGDTKQEKEAAPSEPISEKLEKEKEIPKEAVPQQQQKQPARKQDKLLDTFLKEDEKGNLVNSEGEVIALAGKSREYYEGMKNAARKQRKAATDLAVQNMQLTRKFKELYDEYKGISNKVTDPIQSVVSSTGFSEAEANNAISLMKEYKNNPLQAIKNLLTQAHQDGIDVSSLGANISADPALMRKQFEKMLDERLTPLSQQAEQHAAQQRAEKEATDFLRQYPQAARYESHIAQAKMRFPDMSLSEIWLRIQQQLNNRPIQQRQPQRPPVRQQPVPRKKVTAPVRDYSRMSFEEIAKSVINES